MTDVTWPISRSRVLLRHCSCSLVFNSTNLKVCLLWKNRCFIFQLHYLKIVLSNNCVIVQLYFKGSYIISQFGHNNSCELFQLYSSVSCVMWQPCYNGSCAIYLLCNNGSLSAIFLKIILYNICTAMRHVTRMMRHSNSYDSRILRLWQ